MLPSARQSLLRSRPTGARSTRISSPPSGRPSRSPRSWRMGDPSLRPRLPPTTQVRQSDQVKVTHPNVPGWSGWLLSSFVRRLRPVSLLSAEVQRERSRQTHQVLPGAGRPHAQQGQVRRRQEDPGPLPGTHLLVWDLVVIHRMCSSLLCLPIVYSC